MTAKELIKELEQFEIDKEIVIGVDYRTGSILEIREGEDVIFIWG